MVKLLIEHDLCSENYCWIDVSKGLRVSLLVLSPVEIQCGLMQQVFPRIFFATGVQTLKARSS
jgi:hypothetical protein